MKLKMLWRRVLLALTLVVAAVLFSSAPALAAEGTGTGPAVTFSVPWPLILGLLVSTVLPLLVGLVTRLNTSPGLRAVILAGLAAVTGLLSELGAAVSAGRPYDLGVGLLAALGAFLVAVGMHFGLFKPTGAADAAIRAGDPNAPKEG
jgi:hypothetical protein